MPNPYDQFDAPPSGSNPYDQFDETPAPKKKVPKSYTLPQALKEGAKNMGKGAVEFGTTVKDAYLGLQDPKDMVTKGAGFAASVPGAVGNLAGGMYSFLLPAEVQQQLANAKPEMKGAADKVLQDYYDRYHDWDAVKRGIAEHPYKFMADVATAVTLPMDAGVLAARTGVMGAGAQTAARAANAPKTAGQLVKNIPRYVAVPTHGVNDVASSVANRAIPWAARKVEDATHPTNALMMRTAGTPEQGQRIVAALRGASEGVTPSQAVTQVPAPRFAALGKAAERRRPDAARVNKNQQNADVLAQVRTIGADRGTATRAGNTHLTPDQRIAQATSARDADAARLYGMSDATWSVANDRLYEILGLPLNSQVLQRAERLAANNERMFGMGSYVPPTSTPNPLGHYLPPITTPAQYPRYSGLDLQDIKRAFDDLAFDARTGKLDDTGGLGPAEVASIRNNRQKFLDWVETQGGNPYLNQARQAYERHSRVIDRNQVAKVLEQKLTGALNGPDAANLAGDAFAAALDTPLNEMLGNNLIRATGTDRFKQLSEFLTPEEMALLDETRGTLSNSKLAETLAGEGGVKYATDLDTAFSDVLGVRSDRWWSRPFTMGQDKRIADEVSNAMLTPEGAAQLMENALARERTIGRINAGYNALGYVNILNPFRIANRYPSLYNAMATQQDPPPQ